MNTSPAVSKQLEAPSGVQKLPIEFEGLYTLMYMRGGMTEKKFKHFRIDGPIRDAINRGKRHCELMGYRFLRVDPFLYDLAKDEERNAAADYVG